MDGEAIEERISSLKSEIESYGSDILKHISALYSCNSSLPIDLKNDPRNVLKMLQVDVKDLLTDAEAHSAYTSLHADDIKACADLTQSLEYVAAASSNLEAAEEAILGNDLTLACDALSTMQKSMSLLPSPQNEMGAGAVCQVLRHTAALTQSRFQARLRRLLEHAVQISRGRIQVLKIIGAIAGEGSWGAATEEGSGILLQDLWQAALSTKEGVAMVHRITLQVWTDVLTPLWREKRSITPTTLSSQDKDTSSTSSGRSGSGSSITSEICFEFSSKRGSEGIGLLTDDPCGSVVQHAACRMKFPHLLEAVSQVMGFMYSEVFLGNDEVLAACSSSLRNPPIDLFSSLSKTLLAILPKVEPDMAPFQSSLATPCHEFEQRMNLYGFLSNDETRGNSGPLTDTVGTLYSHFLSARRFEILAKARSLVLGDYHNTMLGTGDALEDETSSAGNIGDRQALLEQSGSSAFSPFQSLQFESCQISLACCRLLKLIHEVLKQAVGAGDSSGAVDLAVMLYRTSRDCLEIFEGVVKGKYADSIQSVARMGAVFFNDCAYIAHNTTLLTHMYRQGLARIAPQLTDAIGYIDFIPRFRSVGEKCLGDHVEAQRRTLKGLVRDVHVQVGEEENQGGIGVNDADAALRVVKHLHRLQGQWQHILQDSVYERLMGYLLEYVIRAVMKPVFEAKYISELAAADITKLFKELQKASTIFEECLPVSLSSAAPLTKSSTKAHSLPLSLFSSSSASSPSLSPSAPTVGGTAGGGATVAGGLVSWTKFIALTDLLDFSLSDIAEWLPRRKFVMFTGQELSSLVRALFEDSPRRQSILASILEMAS